MGIWNTKEKAMNARATILYRPSMGRDKLEEIVLKKLHYKSVNRFIDEAVTEKLIRKLVATNDPELTQLISKLVKESYKHKGRKFLKPSKEVTRKINEKAKPYEEGKVKTTRWKGSFDKTFSGKKKPRAK
jgi:hypothetical protein